MEDFTILLGSCSARQKRLISIRTVPNFFKRLFNLIGSFQRGYQFQNLKGYATETEQLNNGAVFRARVCTESTALYLLVVQYWGKSTYPNKQSSELSAQLSSELLRKCGNVLIPEVFPSIVERKKELEPYSKERGQT